MLITRFCLSRRIRKLVVKAECFSKKISQPKVVALLEEDIIEKFSKGGGPGGQSVNKTSNKVDGSELLIILVS